MKHIVRGLDVDELKRMFSYDSETGLIARVQSCRGVKRGSACGTLVTGGYLSIRFHCVRYLSHRLAWCLHYGEEPDGIIDHINGIKTDNRICNLRLCSYSDNSANNRPVKRSSTGHKCVYREKRGSYLVMVSKNRVSYWSRHWDLNEAIASAHRLRFLHHGEFTNHDYSPFPAA